MATIHGDDTLVAWKYQVTELNLLFQTEVVRLPTDALLRMNIGENYLHNILPVIQVFITMSEETLMKLVKQKDAVKIKLRMQKYYTEVGTTNNSFFRDYINKTFQLILEDSNDDYYRLLSRVQKQNTKPSEEQAILENTGVTVELFLFDAELAKTLRYPANHILHNATVTDAITLLFTENNIRNILLSPVENTKKYETLVIPPITVMEAILWLDQYYGIYHKGCFLYFGMKRGYVMPYTGRCTVYETNEKKEVCLYVPSIGTTQAANGLGEVLRPGETFQRTYLMVEPMTVQSRDASITQSVLTGLNAWVTDPFTGESSYYKTKAEVEFSSKPKKIINTTENEYTGETYIELTSSGTSEIQVTAMYADMDSLEPNKRFRFIFQDTLIAKKYKGNYILINKAVEFSKTGGKDFTASCLLTFRKDTSFDYIR